ncbi:hypothetical protein AALO_G00100530 [Alosa alosa]|uniref:Cytochrome P450 n=1 Tax=Alosa alosa TaxID=278164 RepID=A0AAV6GXI2_9TELE|nr:hypothetical protein AALO_G00100530 [Alosa alosa]
MSRCVCTHLFLELIESARRPWTSGGVIIPKGAIVMVPTYALHRDPEIWTDPETFNPERFSKENKESIDQYTYMPFGLGPRNCIGMRFALISMKLAIVELLQRFTISTCAETEIPMELGITGFLGPKRPIKLQLSHRSAGTQLTPQGCEAPVLFYYQIPVELDNMGLLAPKRPIKLQLFPRSAGAQLTPRG